MTRHPYTASANYICGLGGYNAGGTKLSLLDACRIRQGVAKALGMDDREVAAKLADYFHEHEDATIKACAETFARAVAWGDMR